MERASLTSTAAKLGAVLAGCPEKHLHHCEDLGSQLGLAWAAHGERTEPELTRTALDKARNILREWPLPDKSRLSGLIDYLEGHLV